MSRAEPVFDERRNRRQLHDRLRDPAARIGSQRRAQRIQCLVRRVRPHDQPLAAGAVDGLDHQLVEPVEHLFERVRVFEPPGVDVRDHRLFAEVVADEVGNVRVHELVVGDPVAHRVGERHGAQACREHQPGSAQHGVGTELLRVEELVVHPPVDHIDPRGAGGRVHPHPPARAEQVAPLDEFDAHHASEECVLVVRRVVHAGRQHHDRRVIDAVGSCGAQGLQETARIVDDGSHSQTREQLGQGLRHHSAIREHVAHPARNPHVVFEHAPGPAFVADHVDPRHVDAHAVGADDPRRLPVEVRRRADERCGDHAVPHGELRTVDVREEGLERSHALRDARLHRAPVIGGDHARDHVQRERALLAGEVECHTLGEVRAGESVGPSPQLRIVHARERRIHVLIGRAYVRTARCRVGGEHLVPGCGPRSSRRPTRGVSVEQ